MNNIFIRLTSSFKYIIFAFIFLYLISIDCFAKNGQIDIDEIIKRQESQRQSIENITATLNQINGKFDTVTRNEDDEIVTNDDTSDEINIDYFMSILSDNKIYTMIKDYLNNFVNYIGKKNNINNDNNEISFIYYCLIVISSFGFAIILNSVATVSGKEATKFYMIISDNLPKLSDIDNKNSLLVENQLYNLTHINYAETKITSNLEDENILQNSQEYGLNNYQRVGELAIAKLETFSNDSEFKSAYKHFQKNRVISGRALEDIASEADEVKINNSSSEINQSFITLIMISKNSNKYAGNEITDINSELNCMDIAFLESFSNNQLNLENNEIWAEKNNI